MMEDFEKDIDEWIEYTEDDDMDNLWWNCEDLLSSWNVWLKKVHFNGAMFTYVKGLLVSHVDDLLIAGNDYFQEEIGEGLQRFWWHKQCYEVITGKPIHLFPDFKINN